MTETLPAKGQEITDLRRVGISPDFWYPVEQRAWDEQGQDRNRAVFPLILDLRDVLRSNGVPISPDPACAATPCSGAQR